jgi:hypothetical protein
LGDSHTQVRSASNISLAYCAEFLQPEIYEFHSAIIPHIVHSLDDPNFEVQEKVCYTLDAFCRYMSESVFPYLDEIMKKLLKVLMSGDRKRQEVMVTALSAMASATEKAFLPYSQTVLQMMNQIMASNHSDDMLTMRGKATECVGIIAAGIGKENFAQYFDPFMQLVLNMVTHSGQNEELREYSYTFFENIAHTLGEDFRIYLGTVMQLLNQCLSSEESALEQLIVKNSVPGSSVFNGNVAHEEEYIGDDEFASDSDSEHGGYQPVRTSMIEERAAAISAAGAIAKACKYVLSFQPLTCY